MLSLATRSSGGGGVATDSPGVVKATAVPLRAIVTAPLAAHDAVILGTTLIETAHERNRRHGGRPDAGARSCALHRRGDRVGSRADDAGLDVAHLGERRPGRKARGAGRALPGGLADPLPLDRRGPERRDEPHPTHRGRDRTL